MKQNNMLVAGIIFTTIIAATIYYKPIPNRYSFEKYLIMPTGDDIMSSIHRAEGGVKCFIVYDNVTGKVYDLKENVSEVMDPIHYRRALAETWQNSILSWWNTGPSFWWQYNILGKRDFGSNKMH